MARYTGSNTFSILATFYPKRNATLSTFEKQLSGRAVLTNISESSREASITINNLTCIDEGQYKCGIEYFNGLHEHLNSSSTSLIVEVPPSDPDDILTYNMASDQVISMQSIIEGQNITFVCSGNVGKPHGKLIWQQILNNTIIRNFTDMTTPLVKSNESCTYYQYSNVSIHVSPKDHLTKMRCSLYSNLTLKERETDKMNVYYKVRKPDIGSEPYGYKYKEGIEQIKLTCKSDGNPQPEYWWYKMDNLTEKFLSYSTTLLISNGSVDDSGLYICKVNNSFNNDSYNNEQSEYITIVRDVSKLSDWHPNSSLTRKDLTIGISIGIATICGTVIIVIVVVFYKRKKSLKQNDGSSNGVELLPSQQNHEYFSAYASVDIGCVDYSDVNKEIGASNTTFCGEPNSIQKKASEDKDRTGNDKQKEPTKYEYASVNEVTKTKNRFTQNEAAFGEDGNAKLDQNVYDLTHSNTAAIESSEGQRNQHIYDVSFAGEYAQLQYNRPHEPTTSYTIYDKANVSSLRPKDNHCN